MHDVSLQNRIEDKAKQEKVPELSQQMHEGRGDQHQPYKTHIVTITRRRTKPSPNWDNHEEWNFSDYEIKMG